MFFKPKRSKKYLLISVRKRFLFLKISSGWSGGFSWSFGWNLTFSSIIEGQNEQQKPWTRHLWWSNAIFYEKENGFLAYLIFLHSLLAGVLTFWVLLPLYWTFMRNNFQLLYITWFVVRYIELIFLLLRVRKLVIIFLNTYSSIEG